MADSFSMDARFVEGCAGSLFITCYIPETAVRGWVLCFPPFAEEMNKSRTMISAQSRALVGEGFAVVVPDLYGTGDSQGDFADARWETWCRDMSQLANRMAEHAAGQMHFWGIRTGCLLILDVVKHLQGLQLASMLFWQPVLSGKQFVTQFLRLRMAASMMEGRQEKVADLRQQLEAGESLEVAGYELSPELISSLEKMSLDECPPPACKAIWFDISSNSEKPLLLVSRKLVESWQKQGCDMEVRQVVGEPFWSTQELAMAPELIRVSTELISGIDSKEMSDSGADLTLAESQFSSEQPIEFSCQGERLQGLLHHTRAESKRGLLIVVGGPQYRVGSHRQFTLLARDLAEQGIPVLRFDYRGMGDSSGELLGFEGIADDIRQAMDAFQAQLPQLREIAIWGLCDAATAAAFYAPTDSRVKGLVLLNPWVRSEQGEAKAYLKHYYLQRVISGEFWRKVLSGKFDLRSSAASVSSLLRRASGLGNSIPTSNQADGVVSGNLAERLESCLSRFDGRKLFIISGNDLTAAEFLEAANKSKGFGRIFRDSQTVMKTIKEADHTFSKRKWRDGVAGFTLEWLKSW